MAKVGQRRGTEVEALSRVPYFTSLAATELNRLARSCVVRRLSVGEALFEEGQPCRGLLIIADGHIEIRQISLRGREQVFHTEGPGATLGEGPLLDGNGCIASAVASAPSRVLFLPRAEVIRLCQGRPAVALAMLKTMARRVRHFAGIVSDLAFRPVTERVARHLDAARAGPIKPGTCIELTLTHAQLAARLGTVRELVARAFLQLEESGVIARDRSRVTIRDPVRLVPSRGATTHYANALRCEGRHPRRGGHLGRGRHDDAIHPNVLRGPVEYACLWSPPWTAARIDPEPFSIAKR